MSRSPLILLPLGALAVSFLACPTAAQLSVVPANYATSEAPTPGWFPGVPLAMRQQIIVGAQHLSSWSGRSVTALWLRLHRSSPQPKAAASADLRLWLSTSTSVDPDAPSPRFDANHGPNKVLVFAGRVHLPTGSDGDPWSESNTIRIPFSKPFAYAGGHLCLEAIGTPAPGQGVPFWPVDTTLSHIRGSVQSIGTSCSVAKIVGRETATAQPSSLVVGGTAILSDRGREGTLGTLLFGTALVAGSQGNSLAPFGAPACSLYVNGQSAVTVPFARPVLHSSSASVAACLPIPRMPGLLGASWYAQWVQLEWGLPRSQWTNSAGFLTSNALLITLSNVSIGTGMSSVDARLTGELERPRTGVVRPGRGPVLGFVVR